MAAKKRRKSSTKQEQEGSLSTFIIVLFIASIFILSSLPIKDDTGITGLATKEGEERQTILSGFWDFVVENIFEPVDRALFGGEEEEAEREESPSAEPTPLQTPTLERRAFQEFPFREGISQQARFTRQIVSEEGFFLQPPTLPGERAFREVSLPSLLGTQPETSTLEFQGYIVQFKKPSTIEKKFEMEEELEKVKVELPPEPVDTGQPTTEEDAVAISITANAIRQHKESILQEHQTFKAKAAETLQLTQQELKSKIMGETTEILNMIALDITEEEAEKLRQFPEVQRVVPNVIAHTMLMDSVPLINADDVWQLRDGQGRQITGQGIKIAIIDTGVDYTHPDLGGCFGQGCKVVGGYDVVNNDPDPMDDHGHGTHVAATAAGKGVLYGVAPDAEILAYKVLDRFGSGTFDDVIEGVERAVLDGADIISMSLGASCWFFGYPEGCGPDDPLSQAVDNAVDNGIVSVIAAGNDIGSQTINCPGCARKVITVGASTKQDEIAWFSSGGPVIWENGAIIKPDVVAPGRFICAAQWDDWLSGLRCLDDKHISISGTSMAAPHVAGTAALIKQAHPDWTPDEIKMALRNTAEDLVDPITLQPYDIHTQGYGRIDALIAVQSKKPPIARLDTGGMIIGINPIIGYVQSENLLKYTVEYGQGISPTKWTLICESDRVPNNNILCESWDTTAARDGIYTLRLIVHSQIQGITITQNLQRSTDQNIVIVSNTRNYNCSNSAECNLLGKISNSKITLVNNLGFDENCMIISRVWIEGTNISFNCNGNKIIEGEYCSDIPPPYFGILINNAADSQILNCEIESSTPNGLSDGILAIYSENIILKNNSVSNNTLGIYLAFSRNFKLHGNKMFNNIINLDISGRASNHSIDNSNSINGRNFLYVYNQSNITIRDFSGAAVYVYDSNSLILQNNTINSEGIFAKYSSNLEVSNNLIINTPRFGIWFDDTHKSTIIGNTILDANQLGIELNFAEDILVKWNTIHASTAGLLIAPTTLNVFVSENTIIVSPGWFKVFTMTPIQLSLNHRGNFWGRTEPPYFCEYGNQNESCIDNWDSNSPDVIDSCPYDQSYPSGQWPASPACDDPFTCGDNICTTSQRTLRRGETTTITFDSQTWQVRVISASGSVVGVSVDGFNEWIQRGQTKVINGLPVRLDSIHPTWIWATLTFGENADTCPVDCRAGPGGFPPTT